ncbi:hypothetical protein C9439_04415 [archaeon SCG-AAA382B04]|nr:hypothetical protein C9439_04415 [archaeon SCG-AAA382B04]
MNNRKEQALAYLKEAELTLESAKTILDSSNRENEMWAQVVKNAYDAIEQAASAGIAASNQKAPRDHPVKIKSFVESLNIGEELRNSLFKWLRKRSNSQYVDIRGDEINVPHEIFNQSDAEEIIKDAERTIGKVREEIKS